MSRNVCFLIVVICFCSESTRAAAVDLPAALKSPIPSDGGGLLFLERIVADSDRDDLLLWKASTMGPFSHNAAQIAPQPPKDQAEIVKRFAEGNDARRAAFANTIIAKDFVEGRLMQLSKADQKLQSMIPGALGRSAASNALKSLTGREPTWRELLNDKVKGGFVESVDEMRKTKLAIEEHEIYRQLLNTSIADQAESHLRKVLKDRPLPDDARLFFDGTGTVEISYAGKQSLTNVVIVTRAAMKSAGPGNAAAINAINEAFDPGADRNKVAAQYMKASRALHETPQACLVYIPVLEPGDVVSMRVFEQGFYWDFKETKISLYSDSGALLDKVLMVGGPINDLSLSSAERRKLSKPVAEKLVGPVFEPIGGVQIILKRDAGDGPFERCVPVGRSYLPMETKDSVEKDKPLLAVAKSKDAYVALGPKKMTGQGLVLIPKKQIDKVIDLTKKKPRK